MLVESPEIVLIDGFLPEIGNCQSRLIVAVKKTIRIRTCTVYLLLLDSTAVKLFNAYFCLEIK